MPRGHLDGQWSVVSLVGDSVHRQEKTVIYHAAYRIKPAYN